MGVRLDSGGFHPLGWGQPLTWRYLTELPQGRKAARVSGLWRVRGGRFAFRAPPRTPSWKAFKAFKGFGGR